MSAAAAKQHQDRLGNQSTTTSAPETSGPAIKSESKAASGAFDPHDNDAANGLFMLAQGAQGRSNAPTQAQQYPVGGAQAGHAVPPPTHPSQAHNSPHMNGNSSTIARGISEAASGVSDGSDNTKPTKGKGKRGSMTAVNGRRKADEPAAKQPASKKVKTALSEPMTDEEMSDDDEDDDAPGPDGKPKPKMTDEEKRKNFLERNR